MEITCTDKRTLDELVVRFGMIEKKITSICNPARDTRLKKWMDNQEVCGILRISKGMLRVYHEKGPLPFAQIKSEFFYKPEDVRNVLGSSYYPRKRKS